MKKVISVMLFILVVLIINCSLAETEYRIETLNDLYDSLDYDSIESYQIADDNTFFAVMDGVLFSKDLSILYAYPRSKKDRIYCVPSSVKIISEIGFSYVEELKELIIPDNVITMELGTFNEAHIERLCIFGDTFFHIDVLSFLPNIREMIIRRGSQPDQIFLANIEYITFDNILHYTDETNR